jgi:ribose transport system permease protein
MNRSNMRTPIIAIAVVVVTNIILQDTFFTAYTFRSNMSTFLPLILLSMGQAIVLISGEIDLSIGNAAALSNVVCASVLIASPAAFIPAFLAAIAVGVACGLFNGFVVNNFRLPSMVATFATGAVFFGIALYIMPISTALKDTACATVYSSSLVGGVIPIALLILAGVIVFWYILKRFRLSRYIYAVGGNERSARASGIGTTMVKTSAYMLCGFFAGLGGIILTMQFAYGDAYSGSPFALSSIAAAIVGGIAIEGGKGNLVGAIIGALVFGLLTNVIYYAHLSSHFQELIRGVIIIAALGAAIMTSARQKKLKVTGE